MEQVGGRCAVGVHGCRWCTTPGGVIGHGHYGHGVFVRKAALRPIPPYAVVGEHAVEAVEQALDTDEDLQEVLDQGYRELDRRQPVLGAWLADQVASCSDELAQSLGYFLAVTVFLAFREAFPTRLGEVDANALGIAIDTLETDEKLRENDPDEGIETDDLLAMGQPLLVEFVQHHLQEAAEQESEGDKPADLRHVYRMTLVEVIALSHAVASLSGEPGPAN